jgi:hypothetical protein
MQDIEIVATLPVCLDSAPHGFRKQRASPLLASDAQTRENSRGGLERPALKEQNRKNLSCRRIHLADFLEGGAFAG